MSEQEKVMSVKDWLKVWIIMMIPIVNIIMWVKWIVSDNTNYNLKNALIASLIFPIFIAIFMLIFGSALMGTAMFY